MRSVLRLLIGFLLVGGGLWLVARWGGDPRGAADLSHALRIVGLGSGCAAVAGLYLWTALGRKVRFWAMPGVVVLALSGALVGWISAAEIIGHPTEPALTRRHAAMLIALTALGCVLAASIGAVVGGWRSKSAATTPDKAGT